MITSVSAALNPTNHCRIPVLNSFSTSHAIFQVLFHVSSMLSYSWDLNLKHNPKAQNSPKNLLVGSLGLKASKYESLEPQGKQPACTGPRVQTRDLTPYALLSFGLNQQSVPLVLTPPPRISNSGALIHGRDYLEKARLKNWGGRVLELPLNCSIETILYVNDLHRRKIQLS